MKAGDVMTTGAATVRPDVSIVDAAKTMVEHRISGLPVVDGQGKLVGVVTEGDFLRANNNDGRLLIIEVATGGMSASELMKRRVEEIMTRDPITAGVETALKDVVALMQQHSVKRLPIVAEGKVVGILSRANLIMAMMRKA
jgi:CBS domain-containing protein